MVWLLRNTRNVHLHTRSHQRGKHVRLDRWLQYPPNLPETVSPPGPAGALPATHQWAPDGGDQRSRPPLPSKRIGGREKSEVRSQKAGGGSQEAEGGSQEAGGRHRLSDPTDPTDSSDSRSPSPLCLPRSPLCILTSPFCISPLPLPTLHSHFCILHFPPPLPPPPHPRTSFRGLRRPDPITSTPAAPNWVATP